MSTTERRVETVAFPTLVEQLRETCAALNAVRLEGEVHWGNIGEGDDAS